MRLKSLILGIMMSVVYPVFINGASEISFEVRVSGDPDPTESDPRPTRKRTGAKHFICDISENGIYITGMETSGIYQYEVLDDNGVLMVSMQSEQEFITYILAMEESVEVRFYLDELVLSGFIYQ